MELIEKDAIIAELEKKIKQYEDAFNNPSFASYEASLIAKGKYRKLLDILQFIKNLEVKDMDLKEDVDRILYENDWDYDEIDFYEFAKHFFELGLAQKDLTLSNYDKAMITTITNALNYIEELNDSKGHDNVPSQYQSEKDWLKSLKAQKGE